MSVHEPNASALDREISELLISIYHLGKQSQGYPDSAVIRDRAKLLNRIEARLTEPGVVSGDEQRAAVSRAIEAAWGEPAEHPPSYSMAGERAKLGYRALVVSEVDSYSRSNMQAINSPERYANVGADIFIDIFEQAITSQEAIDLFKREVGRVTSDNHLQEVFRKMVHKVFAGEKP